MTAGPNVYAEISVRDPQSSMVVLKINFLNIVIKIPSSSRIAIIRIVSEDKSS